MQPPAKRHYRCYFLSTDGRFKDVIEFLAVDDEAAIACARVQFDRQSEFVGFELWEGTRQVVQIRPKRPRL